ncbi:MAG: heparinase II/III family protein [Desulfobacteraceae bacterium]|nr:heparinase II/III family protein [Desulfobacteraceae bacterium]
MVKTPAVDRSHIKTIRSPEIIHLAPTKASDAFVDEKIRFEAFEAKHNQNFFTRIKFGDPAPDIRSVWESARLQNITKNLFARDTPAADDVITQLAEHVISWIKNNPFLYGVHYLSPMELGLRIPVFFFVLKRLGQDEKEKYEIILSAIYSHAWWVSKNMALYSSLGNHTVCECVGLIFAGSVFKKSKKGGNWLKKGCRLLEQELFHQILEDGGPAEQSLDYHRFVLDLYWLSVDFLESNQYYDCSGWKDRLRKGELFWQTFLIKKHETPSIGDSDNGYALGPKLMPNRQTESTVDPHEDQDVIYRKFTDAGYSVINYRDGLFLTFDHGPLGMAPLYNHGHADALSITLYKDGVPFLIDPGTYRYNGVSGYRTYFKSTRAHNTVCVDGLDQARQLTGFIWDCPYESKLQTVIEDRDTICLKALHNGYGRLQSPVIHHREITVKDGLFCLINDWFSGEGGHEFELHFHLDPNVRVAIKGEWVVLQNQGKTILLNQPDIDFDIIRGRNNPLLGWFSPEYGVLEKTTTLHAVLNGQAEQMNFTTLICLDEKKINDAKTFKKERLKL